MSPIQLKAELTTFQANPLQFANEKKLTLQGKSTSGIVPFKFYQKDGGYYFNPNFYQGEYTSILAYNVHVQDYDAVKTSLGAINASLVNGAATTLMLTTQLTGCSVCFSINGASLAVAHINPKQHDSKQMRTILRNTGGFANGNGGAFTVFGRIAALANDGYPDGRCVVFGVYGPRGWEMFAQRQLMNGDLDAVKIS